MDDAWWGDAIEDFSVAKDSTAKPFQIKVDDVVLNDLNDRLLDNIKRMEATANNLDSLTDTNFEYGMNSRYLKVSAVLSYPFILMNIYIIHARKDIPISSLRITSVQALANYWLKSYLP